MNTGSPCQLAIRQHIVTIPSHMFCSDNCFLLQVRSRTLCAQWTCHMFSGLAYPVFPLSVSRATGSCTRTFPFQLTCFFLPVTCTVLACRLVSGYLFISRFSFCTVGSYTYVSRLCLSPFASSTRLPSHYFWTLTRYRVISLSCIFVLVSHILLYIRVGDVGLFPIFNLLCNHPKGVTCEIPRTLLVLSSSLAKATASRLLGSSPLFIAYR